MIIVSAIRHLVPTLCVGAHIPGHDKHGAPTQSVGARRHGPLAETMIKAHEPYQSEWMFPQSRKGNTDTDHNNDHDHEDITPRVFFTLPCSSVGARADVHLNVMRVPKQSLGTR